MILTMEFPTFIYAWKKNETLRSQNTGVGGYRRQHLLCRHVDVKWIPKHDFASHA